MDESTKQEVNNATDSVPEFDEQKYLTFNEKIVQVQIADAREKIKAGDKDEALKLIEMNLPLIEDFENRFADDDEKVFRIFNEAYEELLFNEYFKQGKKLYYLPTLSIDAYVTYANLLASVKRYDEAIEYYKKALHRNPVEPHVLFMLLETYKAKGDMANLFAQTKEIFKYVYRLPDLGRVHRNMGYYYTEQKRYDLAYAFYSMSLVFDPNNTGVQSELKYIIQKAKTTKCTIPNIEEAFKLTEKEQVPFGPDKIILSMAYQWGMNSLKVNRNKQAKYFLEIVYDITHDKDIKEKIDGLNG